MMEDENGLPSEDQRVQRLLQLIDLSYKLRETYRKEIALLQEKIVLTDQDIALWKRLLPADERRDFLFGK